MLTDKHNYLNSTTNVRLTSAAWRNRPDIQHMLRITKAVQRPHILRN